MRVLGLLLLLGLGFLADWAWGRYLSVWGLAPDWLLIGTVALAGLSGPVLGQSYGFLWGLALDTLAVRPFGAHALLFSLTGFVVGRSRRQMDITSPPSQVIVVGVISAAYLVAFAVVGRVFGGGFLWPGWKEFLLGPVFNAVAAPIVFALVEQVLD